MVNPKRIIAFDVGQARIGVASAEVGSNMAFGRGFINRTKLATDLQKIKEIYIEENAGLIVVGLPLREDGQSSKQTQRVRAFARILENEGYNIIFEDERYSSKIALESIISSGLSKKKRREKGLIDEGAAKIILESYLLNSKEEINGNQ